LLAKQTLHNMEISPLCSSADLKLMASDVSQQSPRGNEMAISKTELEIMNDLLGKGKNIADLAKKYPQYDYWEIYWQVNDYSFLGKKRTITNRLKRLVNEKTIETRQATAAEAQELLDELYEQLKRNSKILVEIDRVLRSK